MKDSVNKQKMKKNQELSISCIMGQFNIQKGDKNQIQVAFAEGNTNLLGNKVTVMSADGKPVQVDASTLQAAQNTQGRIYILMSRELFVSLKDYQERHCQ